MKKIPLIASCILLAGLQYGCAVKTPSVTSTVSKADFCQTYAETAVAQQTQNVKYGCGFTGLRWSNDLNGQRQWCSSVNPSIPKQENKQRAQLLKSCFGRFPPASVASNRNRLPIPASCTDPNQQFIPIRTINSLSHYHAKSSTYQPIIDKKGYIKADLNKDTIDDFVFIEQNTHNSTRLAFCISQARTRTHQRKSTPFKIYSEANASTERSSQRIEYKQGRLLITDQYQEHNWGTDSVQGTYTFAPQYNDLVLTHMIKTSTSGDGYRSNSYAEYDLINRRYVASSTCGEFEDGCRNKHTKGQLAASYQPITLSKNPVSLKGKQLPNYLTVSLR